MILKLFRFINLFFREKYPCLGGQVGQSLFEIIVAVALIGLVLGLGAALLAAALEAGERNRVQAVASRLASELMEVVSAMAGSSWHKIYCPPTGAGTGNCSSQKGTGNRYYATSTLVGYWPMDELSEFVVADTSGFGHDGTVSGAAVVDGYSNKARQFSENSHKISTASTWILNTDIHTIEFWLNINSPPPAEWRQLLAYRPAGTDRSPGIWIYPSAACLHWRYDPGNTGANCVGPSGEFTYFTLNTWYHIAGVKSGSSFNFYVNGNLASSYTVANPKTAGNAPVEIGQTTGYNAGIFIIDEVRIYNRALPQFEIQQHYLKTKETLSRTPVSGTESITIGGNTYTRWFTVENVSRATTTDEILVNYEAHRDDPSTQKITVIVVSERLGATSTLVQYLTRSRNEAYQQTDWSCGLIPADTPSPTNPCGYFAASSTIRNRGQSLELFTHY